MNRGARHVSAQTTDSRALYAVGRQTPQLYECKVSRTKLVRFPPAFGKDELNLGISQSLSTGGLSEPRAAATT